MASESMVKVIYGRPMLPDLARVLACLYEKKVTFELEDLNKGVRMSQDILNLQISSHRHTPVLLDGPDELFGSRKICRHIVEKYGAYGYQYLLGKDPLARVSVEQWLQSEEHRFDPPSSALVFYLAFKVEADIEKVTQSEKKLEKVLNLYEQRLGESEFLAGSYFTLADLYHLPNTYYLESSVEYGYLFKDRKNVSRWWKHISERDSWKQVVKKFEEEGLQFNVSVSNGKTDQSSSSRHKNGVRNGPIGGTELSSKKKEAKEDIREEDEGEINASGNKKERTPSKEKKDDEAVQRKVEEGKKAKTPSADNKEHGAKKNDEIKEHDASKKETPKSDNKEMSGKTDEIKERDAHKPATEDKKETPRQADQDKSSSGDKSQSVRTEETKDRDANKPTAEGEKEKPKPDGKDKSSTAEKEKPGQTDETNTRDANKPDTEGEKDAHNHHDNLHDKESEVNKPAREDKKTPQRDEKDKASPGGNEKPVKNDEIKERDANKKDVEGEEDKVKDISDKAGQGKIHENKEHTANDSDTEGKRDGFKSDGKDKDSSGREKERDVNKENVNRGVSDSDNQVKKDSSPNDGKDKTSAGENKDTTPRNEKDKTN